MSIYINKADSNTVVHLGHGDLSVSTSQDLTEVIFTPAPAPGVIGDFSGIEGKRTSEYPPGVRIVIDDLESGLVVIDALSKVCQHLWRTRDMTP